MIKAIYRLPLRALEGFLHAMMLLLSVCLPVPSYTQICRRAAHLGQTIHRLSRKRITDIVFDSSGLKVFGEGEWKVRQHGKAKKRTWRKMHLGVCADSQEIVMSLLTDNAMTDGEALSNMATVIPNTVERAYGDGAYDKSNCYQIFQGIGAHLISPPQKGAVLRDVGKEPWIEQRNNTIREILGLGGGEEGRRFWKKLRGYHRRSLAETAMYRFKTLFGSSLAARDMRRQRAELYAKSLVMNHFTKLGMPKGQWE
jgi:Transposase DDE domain